MKLNVVVVTEVMVVMVVVVIDVVLMMVGVILVVLVVMVVVMVSVVYDNDRSRSPVLWLNTLCARRNSVTLEKKKDFHR